MECLSRQPCGTYVETLSRLLTSCTLGSRVKGNGCFAVLVIPFEKFAGRSLGIWTAPIQFSFVRPFLLDSFEHRRQIALAISLWSLKRVLSEFVCEHAVGHLKRVRHCLCGTSSQEWKGGSKVRSAYPAEARQPIQRNHTSRVVRIVGTDDLCFRTLS